MRFLVDAHLPRSLCAVLARQGHDAIHTLDLPTGDADCFYSHVLQGRPWKLVLVKTGNISTHDLQALFERHLPTVAAALQSHTLVEIDRLAVTPVV